MIVCGASDTGNGASGLCASRASDMIRPLTEKNQAEISDLQLMTPELGESDARRLLQQRHSERAKRKRRSLSTPTRSAASRKTLVDKHKSMRGWSTPPRGEKDYSITANARN